MKFRYEELGKKLEEHIAEVKLQIEEHSGAKPGHPDLVFMVEDFASPGINSYVSLQIGKEGISIMMGYAPEDFPYGWTHLKPIRRNIIYYLTQLGLTPAQGKYI